MYNFFVKNEHFTKDTATILGEDVNHIKNVLRMEIGTKIYTTNIETHIKYLTEIKSIENEKVECNILEEVPTTELPINITLYQGLPKSDKLEFIIEKATELGACKIVPVEMRFSIAKIKNEDKKIVRWNKIAESAAKQSKRNIIPSIEQTIKVNEMINQFKQYDLILVAYENESKQTLKDVLKNSQKEKIKNVALVIGPEGGVDSKEIELLVQNGAKCVSLGKRILRTETAPLTLLSMLIYEFEL